jgi:hypothetical protein
MVAGDDMLIDLYASYLHPAVGEGETRLRAECGDEVNGKLCKTDMFGVNGFGISTLLADAKLTGTNFTRLEFSGGVLLGSHVQPFRGVFQGASLKDVTFELPALNPAKFVDFVKRVATDRGPNWLTNLPEPPPGEIGFAYSNLKGGADKQFMSWTSIMNAEAIENGGLTKENEAANGWNGGAIGMQDHEFDVLLSYKCTRGVGLAGQGQSSVVGLTHGKSHLAQILRKDSQSNDHRKNIDCALECRDNGQLYMHEKGVQSSSSTNSLGDFAGVGPLAHFNSHDVIEIRRTGTVVSYWKDGTIIGTCGNKLMGFVHAQAVIRTARTAGLTDMQWDTLPPPAWVPCTTCKVTKLGRGITMVVDGIGLPQDVVDSMGSGVDFLKEAKGRLQGNLAVGYAGSSIHDSSVDFKVMNALDFGPTKVTFLRAKFVGGSRSPQFRGDMGLTITTCRAPRSRWRSTTGS